MIRKDMTYENTYRDDNVCEIWDGHNLFEGDVYIQH
jgi:hypothetical protein